MSPGERAYIGQIENGRERFNRLKLRMASLLPDLPDPVLDLARDQEAEDLVIRLGACATWRPPPPPSTTSTATRPPIPP